MVDTRHDQHVEAADHVAVRSLMRWADLPRAVPKPQAGTTWTGSREYGIPRRSQGTRVMSREETVLPPQEVNVGALSPEWVRRRMEDEALHLFDEVRNLMIATGGTARRDRKSHLRIATGYAHKMKHAGAISHASDLPTKGWVIPFSVVEGRKTGEMRRFTAWPRVKQAKNDYDAEVPLDHMSQCLSAVYDESAALFDLKASFVQVDLSRDIRAGFRYRTESGELVKLN
ncbi:unnamed protein product [Trypanosoma congolense IL3000]|uniref:WGS project CAEQ00000000 data, annotated contig 2211 n=1 Tax=Trypanosoma congolense (strain IL3000) TaxID=1068625 RepID=F9WCB7_TRYCI|nr:unnamed protein product [Trypanosoma congolense IL3000]